MEYEVYLQVFVLLGVLHIVMDAVRLIVSLCKVAEIPISIDERLDIIEEHIIQLMEGEYVSTERNTIIDEKED